MKLSNDAEEADDNIEDYVKDPYITLYITTLPPDKTLTLDQAPMPPTKNNTCTTLTKDNSSTLTKDNASSIMALKIARTS